MSKLITALFAGALFGSSYMALAVESQPMEDSTYPNSSGDQPVENMHQEPDATGEANTTVRDRNYNVRSRSGTNNPNSNSDVSGADQIERGSAGSKGKVEKLRQKPANPDEY
jgi:hypothetical protein